MLQRNPRLRQGNLGPEVRQPLLASGSSAATFAFDLEKDSLNQNNLIHSDISFSDNEHFIKAYLQNYSKALLENKMTFKAWEEK